MSDGDIDIFASGTVSSTGTLDAANNNKPRILSLGAQYSAGPIYISGGYERHKDANGSGALVPVTALTAREGDDPSYRSAAVPGRGRGLIHPVSTVTSS